MDTLWGIATGAGGTWAVGEDGVILKQESTGDWVRQLPDDDDRPHLYAVAVAEHTAWVVGDDGTVYKTENGGLKWVEKAISNNTNDNLQNLVVKTGPPHQTIVWVVGNEGTILRTDNGGGEWTKHSYREGDKDIKNANILGIDTTSDFRTAYAVANEGYILRSTQDSDTWDVSRPTTKNLTSVVIAEREANDPEYGKVAWAVGDDEIILRTQDGGDTWEKVHPREDCQDTEGGDCDSDRWEVATVRIASQDIIVTVGSDSLIVWSDDGGKTWKRAEVQDEKIELKGILLRRKGVAGSP